MPLKPWLAEVPFTSSYSSDTIAVGCQTTMEEVTSTASTCQSTSFPGLWVPSATFAAMGVAWHSTLVAAKVGSGWVGQEYLQ